MSEEQNTETSAAPDLKDPVIQAAIRAAVEKKKTELESEFGAKLSNETRGLRSNFEDVKREKLKLQEELEATRTKAEAAAAGVDAEVLERLSTEKAKKLLAVLRQELDADIKADKQRAEKAEAEAKAMREENLNLMLSDLIPYDSLVPTVKKSPAVHSALLADLRSKVSFQDVNGIKVAVFNGEDGDPFPGNNDAAWAAARDGKGPLGVWQPLFASNGKGSGTTSTNGAGAGAKNLHKMTAVERAAFTREHGLEAFKEALASTPFPEPAQDRR